MNALDVTTTERRVMELAKRITDLYSVSELEQLSPISPQTIVRWAEGKHRPSKSTASVIPAIIAVSDQNYQDYLEGNLSLDELWALKGSANRVTAKKEISLQSVLNDAKLLNTMERLKLMSSLWLTLSPVELEQATASPKLINLTELGKKRLRNLLNISNAYLNQTAKYVIEHGANKALIEDMLGDFENQYTEPVYASLIPFLCRPDKWNGEIPIITDPANKFNSVDELVVSLNAS